MSLAKSLLSSDIKIYLYNIYIYIYICKISIYIYLFMNVPDLTGIMQVVSFIPVDMILNLWKSHDGNECLPQI